MNEIQTKQAIVTSLAAFAAKPLAEAATALLESLGYTSKKRFSLKPNTANNFVETFAKDKPLNPENAILDDWQSVDLLFQITDDEIRDVASGGQQFLFDSKGKFNGAAMESYLFFAVTLKNPQYTRTELSGITRAVNRLFPMPVMLLFRHGPTLTLSIINRRLHKRDESKDVLEKVTLIKDIRIDNPHRAHIEILHDLSLAELYDKHSFTNFIELHAAWQKTLDSSELNKKFFQEIANWYFWALKYSKFPMPAYVKDADAYMAQSLIRLLTRLIFCWFIKEKGLISDILFDERKLPQILDGFAPGNTRDKASVFYKAILQNLFFATLNTEMNTSRKPDSRKFRGKSDAGGRDTHHLILNVYRYEKAFRDSKQALKIFSTIPFLNGGLFECLDKSQQERIDGFSDRVDNLLKVPDFLFFGPETEMNLSEEYGDNRFRRVKVRGLIHTFNHYKFTIAENTPIEEEIALDPELSGKVFENLLAAYDPNTGATARKQTGSFYTPREIVNYMVDEALIACLKTKLEAACPSAKDVEARLRHLFAYNYEPHNFTLAEVDTLIATIDGLRTLDPAVGSGAFPMGILHKLVFILGKLDPKNEKWKERQRQRAISETAEAFKIGDREERQHQLDDINEVFEQNASDYGRKLYLIENCIYGVDIQSIAVQIAKMRFFISLVADQKVAAVQPNCGVRPLPNLETKFVAANTLIGIERPEAQGKLFTNPKVDRLKTDLTNIRHCMFTARTPGAKSALRKKDESTRLALAENLKKTFRKANEGEIRQTEHDLQKATKELAELKSKPVEFQITRTTNLFGEEEETRVDLTKEQKRLLRNHIKDLETRLRQAMKLEEDLDAAASQMAAWDPYDQNTSAPFFDPEWMFGVVDGFDITIGNPPYGFRDALTPAQKKYFRKDEGIDFPSGDIAELFVIKSFANLVKPKAVLTYLVPKKTLYGESWSNVRRLWKENDLYSLMDASQAFENVLLEQAVFALKKRESSDAAVRCAYLAKDGDIREFAVASKSAIFLPNNTIQIYKTLCPENLWAKIHGKKSRDKLVVGQLGLTIGTPFFSDAPMEYKLLKGIDTERWIVRGHRFLRNVSELNWEEAKKFLIPKVVCQVIVAHIENPSPHLKITASFDAEGIIITNTLTAFGISEKLSPEFWLGYLNSSFVGWYAYNFIYSRAIRTMHFYDFYIQQIPIPDVPREKQQPVIALVGKILAAKRKNPAADTSTLEREIDALVYRLYGLTEDEIRIVEGGK